jgi:hypothetical protein
MLIETPKIIGESTINIDGSNIVFKGILTREIIRDGKVIKRRTVKNLTPDVALAEFINLIGNVSTPTAFSYLAVGTGTTAAAAGNTTLETEITGSGLDRAAATVTRITTTTTNDTLNFTKSFSVTGTKAITEAGFLNASSNGTLGGRTVFTADDVVPGDIYALTYKLIAARV